MFLVPVYCLWHKIGDGLKSKVLTLHHSSLILLMYLGKLPRKYSSFIANIPRLLSPVFAGGGGPGLGGAGPLRDQARGLLRHAQSGDQVGHQPPIRAGHGGHVTRVHQSGARSGTRGGRRRGSWPPPTPCTDTTSGCCPRQGQRCNLLTQ